MAAGTVTTDGITRSLKLIEAAAATNGPPATTADGYDLSELLGQNRPRFGAIVLASTAGSGIMSVLARLWVYHKPAAVWLPAGGGGASSKGYVNAVSLGESQADKIRHCEPVELPGLFRQAYLEIVLIGGTSTAISAWLSIYEGAN